MIVEGVTFIEEAIKTMTKKEFVSTHKKAVWLDRSPEERTQMLSDTYDAIQAQEANEQ